MAYASHGSYHREATVDVQYSSDTECRTLDSSKGLRSMIRIVKLALGAPLIVAAALVLAPCRTSFAQGDADLEAPGLEPYAAAVTSAG